jgi:hypothetical protein
MDQGIELTYPGLEIGHQGQLAGQLGRVTDLAMTDGRSESIA